MALRQASGSVRPALSFRGGRACGAPDAAHSRRGARCWPPRRRRRTLHARSTPHAASVTLSVPTVPGGHAVLNQAPAFLTPAVAKDGLGLVLVARGMYGFP